MPPTAPRKYAPLGDYLAALPGETTRITLSLRQIEVLVGTPLPAVAGTALWWTNTPGHPQARVWLAVGWHVAARSLRSLPPTITFARGRAAGTARRSPPSHDPRPGRADSTA